MNKNDSIKVSGGGMSFGSMLAILFIALKLTHVINWSWWWVLSPLWIPFAIIVGVFVIFGVIAGVAMGILALVDWRANKKKRDLRRKTLNTRSGK